MLMPHLPESTPIIDEGAGQPVRHIPLTIDYTIIEHFSHHLYGSPNKAVEELVVNGFDAFATEVRVFLDSEYTPGRIIVWDNGQSMDIDGLSAMWQISKSPKRDHRTVSKGGSVRTVIGKFGIGKVASYTLGDSISHICRQGNEYLGVRMDYQKLMQHGRELETSFDGLKQGVNVTEVRNSIVSQSNSTEAIDLQKSSENSATKGVNIYSMTQEQAETLLRQIFVKIPDSMTSFLSQPTWTAAIIENLKAKEITHGRLSWVLGNAMPLRPDFKVWVDEVPVVPTLEKKGIAKRGDMGDADIQLGIQKKWDDAITKKKVSGTLAFGSEIGLNPNAPLESIPYVVLPNLGKVWGKAILYNESLKLSESPEAQRSYGFFIMVLGRLLNDTDPNFLLDDPSFGTFYKSQYVLHADFLDADLLADRERIHRGTPKAKELALLQHAIYLVTTNWKATIDEQEANDESLVNSLPIFSREFYIEPITALRRKLFPEDTSNFALQSPIVDRKVLSTEEAVAKMEENGSAMTINTAHPYYKSLATTFGANTTKGRRVIREFERIAISELLFEGYLFAMGLDERITHEILLWRDKQYRLLAQTKEHSVHKIGEDLKRASAKSTGQDFEIAIVSVLQAMGFVAKRDGASGQKDILMTAPCGPESFTFTFEAKAKLSGELQNDSAEIGGAAAHRDEAKAEHAVVVTRKFAGFKSKPDGWPAILKECNAVGNVSIMETDALVKLAEVMNRYYYSLSQVKPIFTEIEPPELKMKKIEALDDPFDHFDFRPLLDKIWEEQIAIRGKEPVTYYRLWQTDYRDFPMEETEFESKLQALSILADPLILLDTERNLIALKQAPEKIMDLIARRVEPQERSNDL